MRAIRRGETGPAVAEIRSILVGLELLTVAGSDVFDDDTETAVRAFQQSRGIGVDGIVGSETWQALDGARWKLGARTLYHSVPSALVGEDVRALQERLLEMGYDSGRADAIYGARTARAVAQFQREVGLTPDGSCGPKTLKALRRLGRKVEPLLAEIANEMGDKVQIVKVNIDENPETARAYRVMSVPTLTMFKGGEAVNSVAGAKPKGALINLIESAL